MKSTVRLAAVALLGLVALSAPAAVQAQKAQTRSAVVGKAAKTAAHAAKAKGAKHKHKKNKAGKGAGKNATPAQKAWQKSLGAERKTLHTAVTGGTLNKADAKAQLKAWKSAHPRPRPT